jgi:hypothetical protein
MSPHRERRLGTLTLLVIQLPLLALTAPRAWGWGNEGHQTVGAIADRVLAGTPHHPSPRAVSFDAVVPARRHVIRADPAPMPVDGGGAPA